MPFKSEAQRKYLWANEPEIARDWTDTYGSKIHKADGGRIGFASGLSLVASLRAMSDEELTKWNKEQGGDPNAEKILKERANTRVSGKVEAAGEDFWEQFPGFTTGSEQESALPFMKTLEYLKHTKGLNEFDAKRAFEKLREADPEGFEEKYGIDSYEDIGNAIEKGYDEAKGTIEFDPNAVIRAGMLPDFKGMWENIRTAGDKNLSGFDITDTMGVDTPQTTRGPREMFEMAATPREGIASIGPHGWDYGNQWQKPEQQKGGNWLRNIANFLPFVGKNTRTGAFMRMLRSRFMPEGGITSMFNRPTTPQQQATQRFMQNYNVGRNPQTGRMVGGPFAGRNLPGTSMFGSKTPQEMAQNWMKKYGDMQYQTRKQQLKQQQIKNIATMNQGPAGITPKAPRGPVGPPPGGGPHGNGGTQTSGGSTGTGAGGMGRPGGGGYGPWKAEGGLISLWPR